MLVIWLLVISPGIAWAVLTPNTYRSTGKLFVRLGRENVTLDPTVNLGQGPISAVPMTREAEINTVVETLRSRTLMERVVDRLTPEAVLYDQRGIWDRFLPIRGSPRDRAIEKLSDMFDMASVRKSNLLSVSCTARDPQLAQQAVEYFIDEFLVYHRNLNRTAGAHQFFSEHVSSASEQLTSTEEALLSLRRKYSAFGVDEQQRLLLGQHNSLTQDLQNTQAQIDATSATIKILKTQLAEVPARTIQESTSGISNLAADGMREELYRLQLHEQELRAKLTDSHMLVRQARDQIVTAQEILENEETERTQTTEGRNKSYDEIELALLKQQAELTAMKARANARRVQINKIDKQLSDLSGAKLQIERLERNLLLQQSRYMKYAESLEQTRIDASLESERISNISIAEAPVVSSKKVAPQRSIILAILTIFGALISIGVGLLSLRWGTALPAAESTSTQSNLRPAFS